MTKDEIKKELDAWEERMKAMTDMLDSLGALLGDDHESPLSAEISRMMSAYTRSVAARVEDNWGFLATYWVEVINNGTGFMAGSVYVQSTSDLVDVIADNW